MDNQIKRAEIFQSLHHSSNMFVLPNIWDAGSAVVFENAGYSAIATTSAGIAYALGYPDGEDISLEDLIAKVREITRRVSIPLSVDFERGYAESPEIVKANAARLVSAGAVGFNIEDGYSDGTLSSLELQLEKIKALDELKKELSIPFVINARTCAYWLNVADSTEKLEIAIERCNAFADAGADCVFVPGALSEEVVSELTARIHAPLNIIANAKFNDFERLNELGVQRLSIGSGAVRSVFSHLMNIAEELKQSNISQMTSTPFTYAQANAFFKDKTSRDQ